MIVRCPKCKAEYDAGPDYFGKIFRCRCGEEVSVPVPPTPAKAPAKPEPARAPASAKPATPAKPAFTPRPAAPKPAVASEAAKRVPAAKTAGPAPAKPAAKPATAEPAKEGKANAPAAAKTEPTVYAVWAKAASVVGIVFEVFNTLAWIGVFWLTPPPNPAPLALGASCAAGIFFLLAWSVTTALILLGFAALAAIFRTADAACRASGSRPLLM